MSEEPDPKEAPDSAPEGSEPRGSVDADASGVDGQDPGADPASSPPAAQGSIQAIGETTIPEESMQPPGSKASEESIGANRDSLLNVRKSIHSIEQRLSVLEEGTELNPADSTDPEESAHPIGEVTFPKDSMELAVSADPEEIKQPQGSMAREGSMQPPTSSIAAENVPRSMSASSNPKESMRPSAVPLKEAYEGVQEAMEELGELKVDYAKTVNEKLEAMKKSQEETDRSMQIVIKRIEGIEQRLSMLEQGMGMGTGPGMGPGMGGGMGMMDTGMGQQGYGMMDAPMGAGGGYGAMGGAMGPGGANNALFQAVQSGRVEDLIALLAQGADPNMRDPQGNTLLHLAARAGNEQMVRVLLCAGARKDATDAQGRKPYQVAITRVLRGLLCN